MGCHARLFRARGVGTEAGGDACVSCPSHRMNRARVETQVRVEGEIEMWKRYPGVLPDDLVRRFPGWEGVDPTVTLADFRSGYVGLEQMLAASHLLWPSIIEDEGAIFIERSYHAEPARQLRAKFGGDDRHIERWMNAQELIDFFFREIVSRIIRRWGVMNCWPHLVRRSNCSGASG
jgi:hypothetical protein